MRAISRAVTAEIWGVAEVEWLEWGRHAYIHTVYYSEYEPYSREPN